MGREEIGCSHASAAVVRAAGSGLGFDAIGWGSDEPVSAIGWGSAKHSGIRHERQALAKSSDAG